MQTKALVPSVLESLETTYQQFGSSYPFTYSFMNDNYDALYRAEQRTGRVLATFAGLAVLIAAMGLFGLAAFAAQARRKEISIRKVFGASTLRVVGLLSKDFIMLVGFAFIISVPLAWYGVRRWLEGFAYKVDLGMWPFLVAGVLAFLVAAFTTGFQALRVARRNPAEVISEE